MTNEADHGHKCVDLAEPFAGRELVSDLEEIVLDQGTRPRALVRGETLSQGACSDRDKLSLKT